MPISFPVSRHTDKVGASIVGIGGALLHQFLVITAGVEIEALRAGIPYQYDLVLVFGGVPLNQLECILSYLASKLILRFWKQFNMLLDLITFHI